MSYRAKSNSPLGFAIYRRKQQMKRPAEPCPTMVCLCWMEFRSEFGIRVRQEKGLVAEPKQAEEKTICEVASKSCVSP